MHRTTKCRCAWVWQVVLVAAVLAPRPLSGLQFPDDRYIPIRLGAPDAEVEHALARIREGERVLVYFHGGGSSRPANWLSGDASFLERLNGLAGYDRIVVFNLEPSLSFSAALPRERDERFAARQIAAIRQRAGASPDAVGFSAGAALARRLLSHDVQFEDLVLIELPVDLLWVGNHRLSQEEAGNAGTVANLILRPPAAELGGRMLHSRPVDGMINFDVGEWRHAGALDRGLGIERYVARALDRDLAANVHPAAATRSIAVPLPWLPDRFMASSPASALLGGASIARRLGGVDLADVRLRYLSSTRADTTSFTSFAFSAHDETDIVSRQDRSTAATAALAALGVWLRVDPAMAWVNLNPAEPDRIIGHDLALTIPGQAMLVADLEMKRTVGRIIHPDSATGRRFWRALDAIDADLGRSCFSFRQWIVPGDVVVWPSAESIYIVEAALDVKLESEYLRAASIRSADGCSPDPDSETHANAEAVFRRLVLPEIIRRVNHAPEYAALRSAFHARIVAEWAKTRSPRDGMIERMAAAAEDAMPLDDAWRPEVVFRAYLESIRNGEFNVTRSTREESHILYQTFIYGGVDLMHVPMTNVAWPAVVALRPAIEHEITSALLEPAGFRSERLTWLGGTFAQHGALPPAVRNDGQRDARRGRIPPSLIALVVFLILVLGMRHRARI